MLRFACIVGLMKSGKTIDGDETAKELERIAAEHRRIWLAQSAGGLGGQHKAAL